MNLACKMRKDILKKNEKNGKINLNTSKQVSKHVFIFLALDCGYDVTN